MRMHALAPAAAAAILLVAAPAAAEPVEFAFDPSHSIITFAISHGGMSDIHGRFNEFSGTLMLDRDDPAASSVSVTIPAWSVDTAWQARDRHLRSADFFNVAAFPTATFTSTAVEVIDEAHANVTGDLTMLGVTHPVTLAVTLNGLAPHPRAANIEVAGFVAEATITRSQWGMIYGLPAHGDEVRLAISVEAQREIPAEEPPAE